MKRVIELVEQEKACLPKNNLFKWLSDESIDGFKRLSFSPSMLYYLMGFKDVLAELQRENPVSEVEEHINAYCGEDAEHWRWYLRDLETLGYDITSWGKTIPAWCNEVWSKKVEINRKTIFDLIHYARSCKDPLFSVALIMIFEATGVVFIGHTRKAAIAINMDDDLKYFGRIHYEDEFGHSVQAKDFEKYTMSEETFVLAQDAIKVLFKQYDHLFECWYQHRDQFPTLYDSSKQRLKEAV